MLPYWYDRIVPDLMGNRRPFVVAHGNSMRALVKHLDGLSEAEVVELNIPTGIPLVYELDSDMAKVSSRYLGDPEAAAKAAAAVARQAG
jgi:2,3-bisphosphoglycerate-dependent phosphoglycerate mutase